MLKQSGKLESVRMMQKAETRVPLLLFDRRGPAVGHELSVRHAGDSPDGDKAYPPLTFLDYGECDILKANLFIQVGDFPDLLLQESAHCFVLV